MEWTALKAGSLSRKTKRRDGTDGLGQKTGKKKFALLMSDPLMDWFRTNGDELCPRIDANLSCELERVLCTSPLHIAISLIKRNCL